MCNKDSVAASLLHRVDKLKGTQAMNRRHGFTLIELMIVVAIIAVIASVAVPNVLRARMAANESSAVGNLKTISTQQALFRMQEEVDQDWDGNGEAGLLSELCGEITPRSTKAAGAVYPTYIAIRFSTGGANGNGTAEASGYLYRMFLADSETTAGDDRTLGGTGNAAGQGGPILDPADGAQFATITIQENSFVCYAWPVDLGATGSRTYVVNEVGESHSTKMNATPYAGAIAPLTDYTAAYAPDGSTDTWFNNPLRSNSNGNDGNLWITTGS